jgi:A118 family predicted phage portal protein
MTGYSSIKEVCPESTVSSLMETAIDSWTELYKGRAAWLSHDRHTLGLPAQIAAEMAMLVTLELEIKVNGESKRSQIIQDMVETILPQLRVQTEYGCASGGLMFRPSVSNDRIVVNYSKADTFLPTAYDSSGRVLGADFIETQVVGKQYFTRIERHYFKGRTYVIENKAYKSYQADYIGTECPLTECHAWADIEPLCEINDITQPLFSYFRVPLGNTIDPESPLGVSVYAGAIGLIRDADEQYQRLIWEYTGGELAIDASEEVMIHDLRTGRVELPQGHERLYRLNAMDADSGGDTLKAWTPTLRDNSYIDGLDEILTKIEDKVHLSRGTLCKRGETQARTAEEIKMTKQRSYATISTIQGALQSALDGLVAAADELITLYNLAPIDSEADKCQVSYLWDDSIVVDAEAERMRDREEVAAGLMAKWEYRKKWYGESDEQAKKLITSMESPSDEDILFGSEPVE